MKKSIFLTLALLPIFIACKKSNSSSPQAYGISATINGKATTFNGIVSVDTSGGSISILDNVDSSALGSPLINIYLSATTSYKAGLYVNQSLAASNASFTSNLNYTTFLSSSSQVYGSYDDSVTVSSITSSSAAGTFHGTATCRYFDPNTTNYIDSTITIADGKFNVKW